MTLWNLFFSLGYVYIYKFTMIINSGFHQNNYGNVHAHLYICLIWFGIYLKMETTTLEVGTFSSIRKPMVLEGSLELVNDGLSLSRIDL